MLPFFPKFLTILLIITICSSKLSKYSGPISSKIFHKGAPAPAPSPTPTPTPPQTPTPPASNNSQNKSVAGYAYSTLYFSIAFLVLVLIYIIYNCYNCLNLNSHSREAYPNTQYDPYAADPYADPYNPDPYAQQNPYNDQYKPDPYRADPYGKGAVDPYNKNADPYGKGIDPYGKDPYAKNIDPYAKNIDPYAKNIDPYAKNIDPYAKNTDNLGKPDIFGKNTNPDPYTQDPYYGKRRPDPYRERDRSRGEIAGNYDFAMKSEYNKKI